MNIQRVIDNSTTREITLKPGEYKGPLIISRPCIIDGKDATIWAKKGPVIIVNSDNVILRNLHVEVMEDSIPDFEKVAIQSHFFDLKLINVCVIGEVLGLQDKGAWNLPLKIDLGEVDPNEFRVYEYSLKSHQKAKIINEVPGVKITPEYLNSGMNILKIQLIERKNNENVCGRILVQTGGLFREITVVGEIKEKLGINNNQVEVQPSFPRNPGQVRSGAPTTSFPRNPGQVRNGTPTTSFPRNLGESRNATPTTSFPRNPGRRYR